MKTPRVSDIVGIINKIAPFCQAEEWDNVGLQAGDPTTPVERIMVALDPLNGTVEAAVAAKCQVLLTHHPLIFSPLKKVVTTDPISSIISLSLKNNLSIISAHTNYDISEDGLNDLLAERLGLVAWEPLKITGGDDLVKLAVFVPLDHEMQVLEALFPFAVNLGNYRDCSFRVGGTGTFRPLDGAQPFIGSIGTREEVCETRIEVLIGKDQVAAAVGAMVSAHPYEEPAYDLYPMLNRGKARGLGRIGSLAETVTLQDYAGLVKERLAATGIRFVGDPQKLVKKIALCSGSGASLLKTALWKGADVMVTGDIKYHDAREAEALGLSMIDAGHFPTEIIMVAGMAERIGKSLQTKGYGVEVLMCDGEMDPFRYA